MSVVRTQTCLTPEIRRAHERVFNAPFRRRLGSRIAELRQLHEVFKVLLLLEALFLREHGERDTIVAEDPERTQAQSRVLPQREMEPRARSLNLALGQNHRLLLLDEI